MALPVAQMSPQQKLAESMQMSVKYVPLEARGMLLQMLSPSSLTIMAGGLAAWAASHVMGAGEFIDAIFLAIGFATIGFSVFEGADELLAFVRAAVTATSEGELDAAAKHFARAVDVLGVAVVQALLMRGPTEAVAERGLPRYEPSVKVPEPPPQGDRLIISRPQSLGDSLGVTDAYGSIKISRAQPLDEQRISLYHGSSTDTSPLGSGRCASCGRRQA